jgi:hypothetical protein
MSKIPADLNLTMWQIADRGDRMAAADFCTKFPQLAYEMQTRMSLVAGTKGMRRNIAPAFVPTFTPRYLSKPKPKWLRAAPAALALAALAGASLYVAQNLGTPLPDPSLFKGATPLPAPKEVETEVKAFPAPLPAKPDNDGDAPVPYRWSIRRPNSSANEAPPPVTIRFTEAHLQNVIHKVGDRFKVNIEIRGDFPNPLVTEDITGPDAMSFLIQLGNEYGFSALDEGNGDIWLIPTKQQQPAG